jgi:hypothetical protein
VGNTGFEPVTSSTSTKYSENRLLSFVFAEFSKFVLFWFLMRVQYRNFPRPVAHRAVHHAGGRSRSAGIPLPASAR